jgi:hypothetical protein
LPQRPDIIEKIQALRPLARRTLREFPGRLVAPSGTPAPRRSRRSTPSRAAPTTSPTRAISDAERLRGLERLPAPRRDRGGARPRGARSSASRASRPRAHPRAAARPDRRLPPGRERSAMPRSPSCSTTARRSANPVGRLAAALSATNDAGAVRHSDAICSACRSSLLAGRRGDWKKNRVYIPQEDLDRSRWPSRRSPRGRGPHWRELYGVRIHRGRARCCARARRSGVGCRAASGSSPRDGAGRHDHSR